MVSQTPALLDSQRLLIHFFTAGGFAKTAFLMYMTIRRPAIADTHVGLVNGEKSIVLARESNWYMPPSEKQYWLDLADDYREEFKRRFPSFRYRARPDARTTRRWMEARSRAPSL